MPRNVELKSWIEKMKVFEKYILFIKQNGMRQFLYFSLRKLFFVFYKRGFKCCGSVFFTGSFRVTGKKCIEIGKLSAGTHFRMDAIQHALDGHYYQPKITIGTNVSFGDDAHIGCTNRIVIGNNVLFGSHVYISDHDHGIYGGEEGQSSPLTPPAFRRLTNDAYVEIEDNVFVGEYAAILKNVIVKKGAIIGAHAVVTKDVPEFSIVAGNPARVVRKYDFEKNRWLTLV